MGLLSVWMNGCLIFLPVLQFFLCCLFDLSNFNVIFYLIILLNCIFVIFCCHFLEACCFLMADKKGVDLREIDMERNKEE